MKLFADLHTHTTYSCGNKNRKHASGTVLENAQAAKQNGLKQIAITEHGFSHKMYGLQRQKLQGLKKEIEEARKLTGIDILFGIEANIINADGLVDLKKEDFMLFDYVVVGFHKTAFSKNLKDILFFSIPNILNIKTKRRRKINTRALSLAMQQYDIDLISHPQVNFALDIEAIIEVAEKTNTHLEINGRRIAYSKKDINLLNASNVSFLMDSDAHSPKNVGNVKHPISFAVKKDIDLRKVINLHSIYIPKKQRN